MCTEVASTVLGDRRASQTEIGNAVAGRLKPLLGDDAPSPKTVTRWFSESEDGQPSAKQVLALGLVLGLHPGKALDPRLPGEPYFNEVNLWVLSTIARNYAEDLNLPYEFVIAALEADSVVAPTLEMAVAAARNLFLDRLKDFVARCAKSKLLEEDRLDDWAEMDLRGDPPEALIRELPSLTNSSTTDGEPVHPLSGLFSPTTQEVHGS